MLPQNRLCVASFHARCGGGESFIINQMHKSRRTTRHAGDKTCGMCELCVHVAKLIIMCESGQMLSAFPTTTRIPPNNPLPHSHESCNEHREFFTHRLIARGWRKWTQKGICCAVYAVHVAFRVCGGKGGRELIVTRVRSS